MKKLLHLGLGAALIATLSGCNLVQALRPDITQKVFIGPSFYGKELPAAYLTENRNADSGHDFRGYHFGKRHWSFKDRFSL